MAWFLFFIGFITAILGAFIGALDDDVEIKKYTFDSEMLGSWLLTIGGVLAFMTLIGIGISWISVSGG